jgi:2-C-methyl-D-erythritol 4-phosphate cytidylyltransferase
MLLGSLPSNHASAVFRLIAGVSCYTPVFMRVFVVLPAAGIGTRMAPGHTTANAPKQFLLLGGLPVLVHSLRAFAAVPRVSAIYVAVRTTELSRMRALIAEHTLPKQVQAVEGGDHRQQSVSNALKSIPADDDDIILVHDAVRPLIDRATIERTIDAVAEHGAAIAGVPAVDTIKQVARTSDGAIVTATVPREHVVLAQTPQGFRANILKRSFAEAEGDGFLGTDEASIVERSGAKVAVVMGSPENLKITQPSDLELAEFYLRRRASSI